MFRVCGFELFRLTRLLQGWKLCNTVTYVSCFLTVWNMLMCYYMSAFELNVSKALSIVANTVYL